MLASELIQTSYRLAGIQEEAGRGYSTSQGTEGLAVLNSMLDSMRTERLLVYVISRVRVDVIPSQASYTVGPSGDIDIARPEKLWGAGYIFTNTSPEIEIPLICWNDQQWKANTIKDFSAPIPSNAYYEATFNDAGQALLYLWPIPTNNAAFTLYVWNNEILANVASLATVLTFPPGYQSMLEYNLAVWIAARFPRAKLSALTIELAKSTRAKVKNVNSPVLYMVADAGSGGSKRRGGFNILSNTYGDGNN